MPFLFISIGVILILCANFFIGLHTFKKTVAIKKEELTKLKSNIRLVKAKYVQSFRKSDEKLDSYKNYDYLSGSNSKSFTLSSTYLNLNQSHSQSEQYIDRLATHLFSEQKNLNEKISEFNSYIARHSLYASILKIDKIDYIDSENLEKSMELSEIDDFGI